MKKLDDFLTAHAVSNATLAEALGVTREMVRRYREGEAVPSERVREEIERLTTGAVKADEWR